MTPRSGRSPGALTSAASSSRRIPACQRGSTGVSRRDARVERLERSYRSTRPILEYASRLLPRGARAHLAFQAAGPEPSVVKTGARDLGTAVVSEVYRLLRVYSAGTAAVITVAPPAVHDGLRPHGWAASRLDPRTWERGGQSVTVISPNAARGLEFDAVSCPSCTREVCRWNWKASAPRGPRSLSPRLR